MMNFIEFFEQMSLEKYAQKYNVDVNQLRMGVEDEKEHDDGGKLDVVKKFEDLIKIAVAHLEEDPRYYTKIKKALKQN